MLEWDTGLGFIGNRKRERARGGFAVYDCAKEITMTTDWKNAMTREAILALLTDAEVAKISEAEGSPLIEGDAYVDLEDVTAGVQQVHAVPRAKSRHVLARSSVSDATWGKIVAALK